MLSLRRYTSADADAWNAFVKSSRNGTLLLDRRFMDYHADRFCDHSLIISNGTRFVSVLPANYDEDSRTLYSHQGLTYGGLIVGQKTTGSQVITSVDMIIDYCRNVLHADRIVYKPIPYIYNKYPSEDDLYALFRHNATLASRGLSSCIDLTQRMPFTESRKSGLRKAIDITVRETDDTNAFWQILNDVLTTRHNVRPVHSPEEMTLLMNRFPDRIKLFGAYDADGAMQAGAYVFDCGEAIHTQYLAATPWGKSHGALDKVIEHLILRTYPDRHYLDFGISTEDGGKVLNEGLLFQKEGFGGRGVCYDCYSIALNGCSIIC